MNEDVLRPLPARRRLAVLRAVAAYAARATLRQPACLLFMTLVGGFFAALAAGLFEPPGGLRLSTGLFLLAFVSVGVAGVVPECIGRGTVRLLLVRPVSRAGLGGALLVGVAGAAALIAAGTGTALWLAEGVRTGDWAASGLLYAVPLSFCTAALTCWIVFIGVASRSAMAAALAGILHVFFLSVALRVVHDGGIPGAFDIQNVPLRVLTGGLFYLLPDLYGLLAAGTKFADGNNAAFFSPFAWGLFSATVATGLTVLAFRRADV